MSSDDGKAYGKTKAHISLSVTGRRFVVLQCAVKQVRQIFFCNTTAIVCNREVSIFAVRTKREVDAGCILSVNDGIFAKIGENLLNEDDIHGNN